MLPVIILKIANSLINFRTLYIAPDKSNKNASKLMRIARKQTPRIALMISTIDSVTQSIRATKCNEIVTI